MQRPITRSLSRSRDNLVSELGAMGELITIQKQLEALMTMYRDDKAAAEMRQQRLEMRFEERGFR